jgi:hypothetical protein
LRWIKSRLSGWCTVVRMKMWNDIRLPLFGMLEAQGLVVEAVEAAEGMQSMARAMRRCVRCNLNAACCAAVDAQSGARPPEACPNASVFYRASVHG